MVPVGDAAHLDRHGSNDTVALEPQLGSTLSSIVIGALDISAGPTAAGQVQTKFWFLVAAHVVIQSI